MEPPHKDIQLNLRVESNTIARLVEVARKNGMTKSTLARRALEVGLAMIEVDSNALVIPVPVPVPEEPVAE